MEAGNGRRGLKGRGSTTGCRRRSVGEVETGSRRRRIGLESRGGGEQGGKQGRGGAGSTGGADAVLYSALSSVVS